ncbi:MAG: hypothetical protein ABIP15_00075 [Devosia sp.]
MRLLSIAIAAAAASLMIVPSAFAMDKMDGDAWLKMIFHGKPGEMMPMAAMPAMAPPMAPMKMEMKPMGKMPMMMMPDMHKSMMMNK